MFVIPIYILFINTFTITMSLGLMRQVFYLNIRKYWYVVIMFDFGFFILVWHRFLILLMTLSYWNCLARSLIILWAFSPWFMINSFFDRFLKSNESSFRVIIEMRLSNQDCLIIWSFGICLGMKSGFEIVEVLKWKLMIRLFIPYGKKKMPYWIIWTIIVRLLYVKFDWCNYFITILT
jgi:hypothetical protein